MHVDHNMYVIGCNMHVTCTLFRIGSVFTSLATLAYSQRSLTLNEYICREKWTSNISAGGRNYVCRWNYGVLLEVSVL